MKMIKVNSSCVDAVGFENCVLVVRFTSGAVYAYYDVPKFVFDDIVKVNMLGESVGKFFIAYVKPNYDYCKLTA